MKWASAISQKADFEGAVEECTASIYRQMKGEKPDFVAAFVAMDFSEQFDRFSALLQQKLPCKTFVGCSGGGIIGSGREVEQSPALSLVAAVLPGVEMKTFTLQDEDLPDLDASPKAWEAAVGVAAEQAPEFILLADPFSIRVDNFIQGMDYAFPRSGKVGGLASGASSPGQNVLYINDQIHRGGLLGVAFMGNFVMDTIVAQGCRPIGEPLPVTACERNILMGLGHDTPLQALQSLAEKLDRRDRELIQTSLFLGLVMDATKDPATLKKGDFLIRNIVGADMNKGLLAIGALLRPGQMVQFHVRDSQASSEDLRHWIQKYVPGKDAIKGALLFSCLGRGAHLYGQPHFDSRMFLSNMGDIPLGGFFCNGEIGPVGGATYVHGYTSCFGLFRAKN